MLKMAVTGGVGCGKSFAGQHLVSMGFPVCEADTLAHKLMEPGLPVFERVVAAFGKDFLDAQGRLDRVRLGQKVFSDAASRLRINALVHPAVRREWERWLACQALAGAHLGVVIVPLLFEAGVGDGWDLTVCVACSPAVQMQRLLARGWSDEECRLRQSAQMPLLEKMALSDVVVMNDGDVKGLRGQLDKVVASILAGGAGMEKSE